jgi:hypothetical protein
MHRRGSWLVVTRGRLLSWVRVTDAGGATLVDVTPWDGGKHLALDPR